MLQCHARSAHPRADTASAHRRRHAANPERGPAHEPAANRWTLKYDRNVDTAFDACAHNASPNFRRIICSPIGRSNGNLRLIPRATHTNCFVNGVARTGPTIAWLVMVPCLPALSCTITVIV